MNMGFDIEKIAEDIFGKMRTLTKEEVEEYRKSLDKLCEKEAEW